MRQNRLEFFGRFSCYSHAVRPASTLATHENSGIHAKDLRAKAFCRVTSRTPFSTPTHEPIVGLHKGVGLS